MAVRGASRWLEASASLFKLRDFTNFAGFKGRQSNKVASDQLIFCHCGPTRSRRLRRSAWRGLLSDFAEAASPAWREAISEPFKFNGLRDCFVVALLAMTNNQILLKGLI